MMPHYKKILLQKLKNNGWELVSQNRGDDWWLEEFWCIRSVRQNCGLELLVLFLVDPLFEGQVKRQGVRSISVTKEMPTNWIDAEDGLVLITVIGIFDQLADMLLGKINEYRLRD